jgi:hypothetical protein
VLSCDKHIHHIVQFGCANIHMKSALAAVAPSTTQLQQLRLLTEGPESFDIAELVWRVRINLSVTVPA